MSGRRAASLWGALVFAGAALAVAVQPNRLGGADESQLLYESLRMLRGEVFLRDVFTIVPPGGHLVFVALFALFGVSITTAKLAMAVVHGLIALATFAAARRLGVRPGLAAAAGLAHVALAQPAFPYASPHWLSTLLIVVLLWQALRRPWAARARGAATLGLTVGALITVHHAKAAVFVPCLVALLLADHLLDRRYGLASPSRRLSCQLAWAAAGVLAVTAACAAALLATAGARPVYAALIEFPLVHYREAVHTTWASADVLVAHLAAYTAPRLLAVLPLGLLPAAGRAAYHVWRGDGPAEVRGRVALLIVAGAAAASIWYYPDFIHVAFIAPLFFVAIADALDWALRRAGTGEVDLAPVAAALLLAGSAGWIARNTRYGSGEYAVPAETAFGRVDLRLPDEAAFVALVRRLADAAPSRRLFVYPAYPALYLMTGTDNPTPYQTLQPGYSPPQHYDVARAALAAHHVPLVVTFDGMTRSNDPVSQYLRDHYDRIGPPWPGTLAIYQRRADP